MLIFVLEFFQLLCDLGIFYYVKVQVVGVVDSLKMFMEMLLIQVECGEKMLNDNDLISVEVCDLVIKFLEGKVLVGLFNFVLFVGVCVVLVGQSGFGKSFLLNILFGFLFYEGLLMVNGVELCELDVECWCCLLSWVGQNLQLFVVMLWENVLLVWFEVSEVQFRLVLDKVWVSEFIVLLLQGIYIVVGDQVGCLLVGQVQCIVVVCVLLVLCCLLLLDEFVVSFDVYSEQ